jgi:CRISPR-associated protein Cas1
MKKLLNTLFVTTQGAYLAKKGETVVVKVENETKLRLPIHTIEGIACFGQVSCSPFVMGLCGERGVGLSFFTENGRFLARVKGPVTGNVKLRKIQYRYSEDEQLSSLIAQPIVISKIANCRTVLQRGIREEHVPEKTRLIESVKFLDTVLGVLKNPLSLETLRGKEGEAARSYFSAFSSLISSQKKDFPFSGRNRRPPLDRVNAMLSFVYTILCHDVNNALEGVGLDPQVGFLHRDRPGRPSLALDLMEEFRSGIADRLVLSLINRRQVSSDGFSVKESGAVIMKEDTRKTILTAYQKRKQEIVIHPFLNEKISFGLIPHVQALLLSRYLRGDIEGYPPYKWR